MPRDKRKVCVHLPDGSQHNTTVSRLRSAFRRQTDRWKENFFYNLLNNGSIDTGTARYTLEAPPRTDSAQTIDV
jgi:hypothetical protein